MNLGQYIAQQLLETENQQKFTFQEKAVEQPIHESPPIDDMNNDYYDYVENNRSKIEKVAQTFNYPIEDMMLIFNGGQQVTLMDEIWKELQNSKSYGMKSLEDAISHSLKIGIQPKPYIEQIKNKKDLPLPMILKYGNNKYYLVGGEIILSIYRALGLIPTVLLGTLSQKQENNFGTLNENIVNKLNKSQTGTISEFIKYSIQNLNIQSPPKGLTLSYNNEEAKKRCSFGTFDPNDNKIWLYVKNRNMADILRTLAHELVHRKQVEDGRIDMSSGQTGSEIENEANAVAGVLLREFGKKNKQIYEVQDKKKTIYNIL